MPQHLVMQFFGLPQVQLDNKLLATDRRKAIALLAYMAVNNIGNGPQRYSRESLSTLLWPNHERSRAFSNLRRTIWEFHQALGEEWLIANHDSVYLNEQVEIDLDVARFRELLDQSRQQSNISLRIPLLIDCIKLYHNHFLTGFSLKDAIPFNDWAFAESEELRRKLIEALIMLVESYLSTNQAEAAIPYGRQLVALDALNETAHRLLMNVYLQAKQLSAALKQYQICEQILRKELNLDPQPETRTLYETIRKGKSASDRLVRETGLVQHNLPPQLTTFIGREKEQDEIINLISKNRLVTLMGTGGIGKTRLALQVAQKVLNDFPSGVWFITFESLNKSSLVPQTIASIFGIREGSDLSITQRLANFLQGKRTLLILDNCEHLANACAQLSEALLKGCPELKILTTSREKLEIPGEAAYYVRPFSIPEHANLDLLSANEAVQLFTERAQLTLSSFALTNENIQTVTSICQRLDGIPLAIELAAARMHLLQVTEILHQLDSSLSLLTSDQRSSARRHQTIRASMNWSWALLNRTEQEFMMRASVFAGGWTLNSAQAVCNGNILDCINALAKKSLIVVNHEAPQETRYMFHEILRQYVYEKLIGSGDEENARMRHLEYYLQFSEQAEAALKQKGQAEWLVRLKYERDNLRLALEFADKTNADAGLSLSSRLYSFGEEFDLPEAIHWVTRFIQKPESDFYPNTKAKALCSLGWSLQWMERFDEAYSVAQECLDLFRATGDQYGEVDALIMLGTISNWLPHLTAALSSAQSLGDTWRQAHALARIAQIDCHDHQMQANYWKQAISLFKEVGDLRLAASYSSMLGYYEVLNYDFDSAQKSLDEAIALNQHLKTKSIGNFLYSAYGRMALKRGDYEAAHAHLQRVVGIAKERGNKMDLLWIRVQLGYLAVREGRTSRARDIFTETARNFQKNHSTIGVVFTLEGMACLLVEDKPENAAQLLGWADISREKISDPRPLLEQADLDEVILASRVKIGEDAFSKAYEHGKQMTLDEAVGFALEESWLLFPGPHPVRNTDDPHKQPTD